MIIILLGTLTTSVAQDSIKGKIDNYSGDQAEIFTGIAQPIKIGSVDANGTFVIQLDDQYKDKVLGSIEAENAKSSKWKTSIPSVQDSYGKCNNGEIDISGGDQTMIPLSQLGVFSVANFEEQKLYGKIMYASSQEFARAMMSFGKFKANKGFQMDWYYFEEPASVKGSCSLEFYPSSDEKPFTQTSSYDLEFKPGWNMVKYEVLEVFTDKSGNQYIQKDHATVVQAMPKGTKVFFLE